MEGSEVGSGEEYTTALPKFDKEKERKGFRGVLPFKPKKKAKDKDKDKDKEGDSKKGKDRERSTERSASMAGRGGDQW